MAKSSVKIAGSETVSGAAQSASKSIRQLRESVQDSVKPLKDMATAWREVVTFGGFGIAAAQVIRVVKDLESSFAKLHPEVANLKGSLQSFSKASEEMKASLGGIISTGLMPLRSALQDVFGEISGGMNKMAGNQVATVLAGTIEKTAQVFKLLWDVIWTTGSGMFVRLFVFMGQVALDAAQGLFGGFRAVFSQIELIWKNVAYAVKSVWLNVITWIVDQLNTVLNLYNNSALAKITGGLGTIGKPSIDLGPKPGAIDAKAIIAPFETAWKKIEDRTVEFGKGVVGSFERIFQDILDLGKGTTPVTIPGGGGGALRSDFNPLTFRDRAKPSPQITSPAPSTPYNAPGAGVGSTGAWTGGIMDALGPLISGFASLAGSIASVKAIMDPLAVIFQSAMQVLAPVVDNLLKPLVGILVILGRTIGAVLTPVLQLLAPVIEFVGNAFVWLYNNVIRPFGNTIIAFANVIYNIGVGIANFIDWLFNWSRNQIAYRSLDTGMLQAISMEDLNSAGADYLGSQTASGGMGSTTTVQQVPDIYVTIYVQGNVIGEGGKASLGGELVDAIKAYLGTGAGVAFLEG